MCSVPQRCKTFKCLTSNTSYMSPNDSEKGPKRRQQSIQIWHFTLNCIWHVIHQTIISKPDLVPNGSALEDFFALFFSRSTSEAKWKQNEQCCPFFSLIFCRLFLFVACAWCVHGMLAGRPKDHAKPMTTPTGDLEAWEGRAGASQLKSTKTRRVERYSDRGTSGCYIRFKLCWLEKVEITALLTEKH